MSHPKKPPTPRNFAYDTYWQFAAKRHHIFLSRFSGTREPWTDDPVLLTYKFCNVFRALDRVSQYMIEQVCYSHEPRSKADAVFQIIAFRMFSRIETWEALRSILGHAPKLDDLATNRFEEALDEIRTSSGRLYTGAFILCATDAFGRRQKHLNHVELFRKMFLLDDVAQDIIHAASLEAVYDILHGYPLYGDFMAYQTAIDLNYSELINFSENDFTMPGPGALRGIKKVFSDTGDYSPQEIIRWMVQRQEREFGRLGLEFDGLWGRKLHAIDAQGLFCETDKYLRVAMPELTSARVRMKAKFTPKHEPLNIVLPPKWGVAIPK